jgi:hypothetical protein
MNVDPQTTTLYRVLKNARDRELRDQQIFTNVGIRSLSCQLVWYTTAGS